jgi:hypothetical protein
MHLQTSIINFSGNEGKVKTARQNHKNINIPVLAKGKIRSLSCNRIAKPSVFSKRRRMGPHRVNKIWRHFRSSNKEGNEKRTFLAKISLPCAAHRGNSCQMFLLSLAYQAKYLKAKRTLPQKAWWNTN